MCQCQAYHLPPAAVARATMAECKLPLGIRFLLPAPTPTPTPCPWQGVVFALIFMARRKKREYANRAQELCDRQTESQIDRHSCPVRCIKLTSFAGCHSPCPVWAWALVKNVSLEPWPWACYLPTSLARPSSSACTPPSLLWHRVKGGAVL